MKLNDAVVGATFVATGSAIYGGTLGFPQLEGGHPGPALFPRILAALMVLFGGALAIRGLRTREAWAANWLRGRGLANALLGLGAVAAYMAVVDRLGFLLTATLLLFGLMVWLHVGVPRAAAIALGVALGTYLLFGRLLLVPLPRGPLGF